MDIKNAVKDLAKKTTFNVKKYSPEILTIGAIGFGIATVVCTWFAARKTDEALKEPKAIIERAKCTEINDAYTKKDQSKEITYGYLKGGLAIAKLYGPAALMGSFSIACILGSYKILSRRNAGLIAVNGILQKEFSDYRDKVIEKYGKEEDYNLRFADKMEKTTETVTDENGEEKTVEVEKPKEGYGTDSFSRCFNEACVDWQKDSLYNLRALKRAQDELNSMLNAKYVLTLNDVYEYFGLERTQAGFQYGWVRSGGTEQTTYVDFGLPLGNRDWEDEQVRNGQRYFWLDFNCSKIVFAETPFRRA